MTDTLSETDAGFAPADLEVVGWALHGRSWRNALAADLDNHTDTVGKWRSGKRRPSPGHLREMAELLRRAPDRLRDEIAMLERRIEAAPDLAARLDRLAALQDRGDG